MRPLGVGSNEPTAMLPLSANEDMASARDATDTGAGGVDITVGRKVEGALHPTLSGGAGKTDEVVDAGVAAFGLLDGLGGAAAVVVVRT